MGPSDRSWEAPPREIQFQEEASLLREVNYRRQANAWTYQNLRLTHN
jgi:hypothetical protein